MDLACRFQTFISFIHGLPGEDIFEFCTECSGSNHIEEEVDGIVENRKDVR